MQLSLEMHLWLVIFYAHCIGVRCCIELDQIALTNILIFSSVPEWKGTLIVHMASKVDIENGQKDYSKLILSHDKTFCYDWCYNVGVTLQKKSLAVEK